MLDQLYPLSRALLFQLDAERAHHLSLLGLRKLESSGLLKSLAEPPPLTQPIECMGLKFSNPVGLAAGLDKEGNTIDALGRLGFGSVEIGTITPRPQPGNDLPRLFRLKKHQAIINRMGFNNPGIEIGAKNVKQSQSYQGIIGFNIGKNKDTPNENATDDYLKGLHGSWDVADYIAVNLSSPNTPGLRDLQAADSAAHLLEALKQEQEILTRRSGKHVPIALKIAPDLEDQHIRDLSRVFRDQGLECLIATNTTLDREAVSGHPSAQEAGGLSGAPLTNRATEVIAAFHSELGKSVPIIGVGGIMTAHDALEKLKAGATLIQLYTGFIYKGPSLVRDILDSLNTSNE